MKTLFASLLLACTCATPAWGESPPAASADASAIAAVKQVGQDMGDAMIALDVDALDRIFGNDWVTLGLSGSVYTKDALLRDTKAGKQKLTWFALGPIDVQIFGDVAIAHGSVAEKRIKDGKEVDMDLVYSDILKRRDGRWVVVSSMGAAIK